MAEEEEMQQITEEDLKKMSPEQIRELQKKSCIFCQIVTGKIPSKKIYDDDKACAILDINPANPGHILLMPREHYMIMPQMPPETINHLFMLAKHLSMACIKALKAQGTNIFVANGAAAGQKAQHFMAHVIPRKGNDNITCFTLPRRQMPEEQLRKLSQVLMQRMAQTMKGEAQKKVEQKEVKQEPVPQQPPKQEEKKQSSQLDLDALTDVLTGAPAPKQMPERLQPPERPLPTTVFATKNGKKFHLQNCPFLQRAARKSNANIIRIKEADIQQRELKPCDCVTSVLR